MYRDFHNSSFGVFEYFSKKLVTCFRTLFKKIGYCKCPIWKNNFVNIFNVRAILLILKNEYIARLLLILWTIFITMETTCMLLKKTDNGLWVVLTSAYEAFSKKLKWNFFESGFPQDLFYICRSTAAFGIITAVSNISLKSI